MAIKTISQFPSDIPADNDYILFEKNGEGKSATIGDAVNTCTLTYEEIMSTTDLSGKVASADALKTSNKWVGLGYFGENTTKNISISKFPLDGCYLIIYYHINLNLNQLSVVNKVGNKLFIAYKTSDNTVVSSDRQTLTLSGDWYTNAYARYLGKFIQE